MRFASTLVAIAALAGTAHGAAKAITLIGISGTGGDRLADELEEGLSDLYEVVPAEVFERTAEKFAVDDTKAIATRLRIDAVIDGSIVSEGRSRRLLIIVRAGASGRVVARGHYDLSTRTLQAVRDRVLADLVRALDHIQVAPPPAKPSTVVPVKYEEPAQESDD